MVKPARPRRRARSPVAEAIGSGSAVQLAPVRARIGRPTIASDDKRKKAIRVLTTVDEHEELKRAAADASMSISTWMRALALERARQLAAKKAKQESHG